MGGKANCAWGVQLSDWGASYREYWSWWGRACKLPSQVVRRVGADAWASYSLLTVPWPGSKEALLVSYYGILSPATAAFRFPFQESLMACEVVPFE